MGRLPSLRPWLRRAAEAGVFAAIMACGTLLGFELGQRNTPVFSLPAGPEATIVLALPVLSLGVIAVAYPIAMAATRSDAIGAAILAFLGAAIIVTAVVSTQILMGGMGRNMRLGLLAATLATPPALAGLLSGELLTPLGFGRTAGLRAAVAATATAIVMLLLASQLG